MVAGPEGMRQQDGLLLSPSSFLSRLPGEDVKDGESGRPVLAREALPESEAERAVVARANVRETERRLLAGLEVDLDA